MKITEFTIMKITGIALFDYLTKLHTEREQIREAIMKLMNKNWEGIEHTDNQAVKVLKHRFDAIEKEIEVRFNRRYVDYDDLCTALDDHTIYPARDHC